MLKLHRHVNWRAMAVFLVVVAAGGYLGSLWFDLPFWIAACVAAAALLINGLIAIIEDRNC